mmetsp:Transcript_1722/g.2273  ORF Transcript_1722/g.2273 Transcript_1722/m.2273 type:complete len:267 (-) Transcript_1722:180-980(-)
MSTAEEFKESGNKAFAAKKFDEAIEFYTKAIAADQSNHVFFSNRSASFAGLKKWDESIKDAKQCIKLNPTFIKGYYRLASAQIEKNDLDAATSSIKQGLNVDPDNSQLQKLMRTIKQKKQMLKAALQQDAASKIAATMPSGGAGGDSSLSKEIMDLQTQLKTTVRDYSYVNGDILKAQKSKRVNEITIGELDVLPNSSDTKMYKGVGKMFMACPRDQVYTLLNEEIKDYDKKGKDLVQKKEYLERRMKSQQQNILELTGNASAVTA